MSFPGQKYALKLTVRFAFHGNMNARKLNAGSLAVGFQQCRLWRRSQIALVKLAGASMYSKSLVAK